MNKAEWSAKIQRWKYAKIVNASTAEDTTEYAEAKIYGYITTRVSDGNLWEQYQADFGYLNLVSFMRIQIRTLQYLRIALRCGGVYVPNLSEHRDNLRAKALMRVSFEHERRKFEASELRDFRDDFLQGEVTSRYFVVDKTDVWNPVRLRPVPADFDSTYF